MRINQLILKDFGPFRHYKVPFVNEDEVCILLTGRNNEGKSSILNGLKLLEAATRVINKTKQEIIIDGNYYYKLRNVSMEIRHFINEFSVFPQRIFPVSVD